MPQQISYRIDNRLYLSITNRCTLTCTFCPKTKGCLQVHQYDLTMQYRPDTLEIIAAIDDPAAYEEVVFCGYGESTLRLKVLVAVAKHIKQHGGLVRVNTDGLADLVHKGAALPKLAECVDALSVSMNAHNATVYGRYCQPRLPCSYVAMLKFLKQAAAVVPNVTATAIAGLPDVDIAACAQLAENLGVKFRQRELDLVG